MWFSGGSWNHVIAGLPDGALKRFVSVPKPEPKEPLGRLKFLATDIETTGLNPAKDQVLSIGFVPVNGFEVDLAGARQILIRPSVEVGESATVHGLTDDALANAVDVSVALDQWLDAMRGRVLLAHHAAIEVGFLGRACRARYGYQPRFAVTDTMSLQFKLLTRGFDDEPPPGSLRLNAARSQYGLPRYGAHNSLTDALACAELYLAEVAELQANLAKPLVAKHVVKY